MRVLTLLSILSRHEVGSFYVEVPRTHRPNALQLESCLSLLPTRTSLACLLETPYPDLWARYAYSFALERSLVGSLNVSCRWSARCRLVIRTESEGRRFGKSDRRFSRLYRTHRTSATSLATRRTRDRIRQCTKDHVQTNMDPVYELTYPSSSAMLLRASKSALRLYESSTPSFRFRLDRHYHQRRPHSGDRRNRL